MFLHVQFEPFPEDDVVSAVNEAVRDTLSLMNASESVSSTMYSIALYSTVLYCTIIYMYSLSTSA